MKSISKLGWFTLALVILLAVLAIGDLDYTISKQLINRKSLFGEFFNILGEIPANLGLLIGTTILYGASKKETAIQKILKGLLSVPFMLLFSIMTVLGSVRYIYEFSETGMPTAVTIAALIGGVALFAFAFSRTLVWKRDRFLKWRSRGGLLIVLVVGEIIVVNLLKIVWARPRMRSITSVSEFKHWYEINGPMNSEEFKSFPSGHTANAFVLLAYTMFIPQDKAKLMKQVTAFAVIWGVCTAISRVILGAHFLSDVFVGGYITILIFYLLQRVWIEKKD